MPNEYGDKSLLDANETVLVPAGSHSIATVGTVRTGYFRHTATGVVYEMDVPAEYLDNLGNQRNYLREIFDAKVSKGELVEVPADNVKKVEWEDAYGHGYRWALKP